MDDTQPVNIMVITHDAVYYVDTVEVPDAIDREPERYGDRYGQVVVDWWNTFFPTPPDDKGGFYSTCLSAGGSARDFGKAILLSFGGGFRKRPAGPNFDHFPLCLSAGGSASWDAILLSFGGGSATVFDEMHYRPPLGTF